MRRGFWVSHHFRQRLDGRLRVDLRQLFDVRDNLGPSAWVAALARLELSFVRHLIDFC